jgi:DNA-binding response OmpR family regulator
MSPQEAVMLGRLIEADGRIVSRQDLYREAMGHPLPARSRAVDVHITRIRKALGPVGRFIIGVPTRGYRLDTFELGRLRPDAG